MRCTVSTSTQGLGVNLIKGLADVLIAGRRLGSGVLQFHRVSTASA